MQSFGRFLKSIMCMLFGGRGGTVERALTSHQCGLVNFMVHGCWFLSLFLAFYPVSLVFLPPQKPTFSTLNLTLQSYPNET